MMPNKTDRHDARGLAQIVRAGWFKAARIKSHEAYVNRAMLTAREALVGMRVRLENEIRGPLRTFGVMFGKRVDGLAPVSPDTQAVTVWAAMNSRGERIRSPECGW